MENNLSLEILHSAQKVVEEAEVFWISSRKIPVHFEANHLKRVDNKESTTVALRIVKEGRIGLATATGGDKLGGKVSPSPNLSFQGGGMSQDLLDMAVETSQFGLPANFQFPSLTSYPQVNIFDPGVAGVGVEKMIELGEELITKVREHAADILCEVEVSKGIYSFHIINSRGGEVSYDKSLFNISLEGLIIQDTDMLFVGDSESSCCLPSAIDILAGRVIRQLELAKEKATVSTKLLPIIFTPRGVANALLIPMILGFNGKMVLEGASPLKNRLGEQVFDKGLNLWDDATIAYGAGSRPCDDEGVPSQRISLITQGEVANFLYDLQTAALAGTQSNGHGERARGGFPNPAISSLIIDEGSVSFRDMVGDMKEGLIVEELIGTGQGDVLSGDFGGNVLLGYKVENGEIVGRVKDTMISGNVYQVLKEPPVMGREARWVNGILRTPPLYCPQVSVAAKGS